VDRGVWATIFDIWFSERNRDFRPSWNDEERHQRGFGTIPVPDWAFAANAPLWEDLDRMRAYVAEHDAYPAGGVVIAVGWLSRRGFRDNTARAGGYRRGPYLVPAEPAAPQRTWRLLGYDIADAGQISGLSNCGYTPEETATLGPKWASRLNDHHLFGDQEAAFAFVEIANARVPEHAPFHVYSLFRLE
jgi:hypothetical protein